MIQVPLKYNISFISEKTSSRTNMVQGGFYICDLLKTMAKS